MQFRGRITQGTRVILASVIGDLQETFSATGLRTTGGTFPAPSDGSIRAGGSYRLELDDGRKLDITVFGAQHSSGMGSVADFKAFSRSISLFPAPPGASLEKLPDTRNGLRSAVVPRPTKSLRSSTMIGPLARIVP